MIGGTPTVQDSHSLNLRCLFKTGWLKPAPGPPGLCDGRSSAPAQKPPPWADARLIEQDGQTYSTKTVAAKIKTEHYGSKPASTQS
jgi:hypothetical protein